MELGLSIEPYDVLVVHLKEGPQDTTVSVHGSRPGAMSLRRALDAAIAEGYGECFWPGAPGGQYWWIFNRRDDSLEVIAMWTRGGASLWEHVFRVVDSAAWLSDRLDEEIDRLAIDVAG